MEENNFKKQREELNMSQQDMAVILSVSRVTYNKWEQEPNTMPVGKYRQLVDELERLRQLKEMADAKE